MKHRPIEFRKQLFSILGNQPDCLGQKTCILSDAGSYQCTAPRSSRGQTARGHVRNVWVQRSLETFLHLVACTSIKMAYQNKWRLFEACKRGDIDTVRSIAGTDPNSVRWRRGLWTPLHSACW